MCFLKGVSYVVSKFISASMTIRRLLYFWANKFATRSSSSNPQEPGVPPTFYSLRAKFNCAFFVDWLICAAFGSFKTDERQAAMAHGQTSGHEDKKPDRVLCRLHTVVFEDVPQLCKWSASACFCCRFR